MSRALFFTAFFLPLVLFAVFFFAAFFLLVFLVAVAAVFFLALRRERPSPEASRSSP